MAERVPFIVAELVTSLSAREDDRLRYAHCRDPTACLAM
jgi:hypothetical protein